MVNRIIFLFIYFLSISFSFGQDSIIQGERVPLHPLLSIHIGMHKNDIFRVLGTPALVAPYNCDCICYYFYFFPKTKFDEIEYRYAVLFFDNSILSSYFYVF